MKFKSPKLNTLQILEIARIFIEVGKAIFLGSVAAYFIPSLVDKEVSISTLIVGMISSLTSITIGIILLSKGKA